MENIILALISIVENRSPFPDISREHVRNVERIENGYILVMTDKAISEENAILGIEHSYRITTDDLVKYQFEASLNKPETESKVQPKLHGANFAFTSSRPLFQITYDYDIRNKTIELGGLFQGSARKRVLIVIDIWPALTETYFLAHNSKEKFDTLEKAIAHSKLKK